MDKPEIKDDLRWYVVYTNAKQEQRAASNLRAWGIETLYPKVKKRRVNAFTGLPIYETAPLFPRYVFARFCVEELFHKVTFTRGVNRIVCFNNTPAQVEDETVALIASNIDEAGFARIGEPFKVGDRLLIQSGPLRGLVGMFEREMKDSERISLLLDAVSYQSHTIVEREMVVKARG